MRRRSVVVFVAAVVAAIVAVVIIAALPLRERLNPPAIIDVRISDGASNASQSLNFNPKLARAEVSVDRIVWMNEDRVSHTVRSDESYSNPYTGKFSSEEIGSGQSYEYVFIEPGVFKYHCDIHPWMRGEIEMLESYG
jgi:plastocyanin